MHVPHEDRGNRRCVGLPRSVGTGSNVSQVNGSNHTYNVRSRPDAGQLTVTLHNGVGRVGLYDVHLDNVVRGDITGHHVADAALHAHVRVPGLELLLLRGAGVADGPRPVARLAPPDPLPGQTWMHEFFVGSQYFAIVGGKRSTVVCGWRIDPSDAHCYPSLIVRYNWTYLGGGGFRPIKA